MLTLSLWLLKRRYRRLSLLWWTWVLVLAFTCLIILAPLTIAVASYTQPEEGRMVSLPYKGDYRLTDYNPRPIPFKGHDWSGGCGAELYAPITGFVTHVGNDGYCGAYGCNNSYIMFQNPYGTQVVMLHGDYTVPTGTPTKRGQTLIGYEASNGNSTGCHTDFWTNGQLDLPLYLTWYDPAQGGINCDSDCSTFANGERVTEERYQDTVACPFEYVGYTFVIPGLGERVCRDTGGKIVIAYSEYYQSYVIHIDVLAKEPPATAQLIRNWRLEP